MKKHCFLFLIFILPCFLFAKNIDVQDILNELNFIRINPRGYIRVLKEHLNTFDGMVYIDGIGRLMRSNEGVDAVYECIEVLENTSPMQALKMNDNLCEAALWFAKDSAIHSIRGHVGSDGSILKDRIDRAGFSPRSRCGEICDYGQYTARRHIMRFLIDDGVPSRGHRDNILNANFKYVGIGLATGDAECGTVVVADFGN